MIEVFRNAFLTVTGGVLGLTAALYVFTVIVTVADAAIELAKNAHAKWRNRR